MTTENRLLGALLAADLIKSMATAGGWILSRDTMLARVASLSFYPELLAYVWIALAVFVLPYFGLQAFGWWAAWHRSITRLACRALLASGVLWAFLAYLSKNIDSANVTGIFILNSLTSVAMSAILASSINTAQAKEAQYQEGRA